MTPSQLLLFLHDKLAHIDTDTHSFLHAIFPFGQPRRPGEKQKKKIAEEEERKKKKKLANKQRRKVGHGLQQNGVYRDGYLFPLFFLFLRIYEK